MSRTELRAQAAVAVYLMHLDAGEGLLVVPDLVALHHRRLGRDEKRGAAMKVKNHNQLATITHWPDK